MLLRIEEKRIEPDLTVIELAGKLALGRESQQIESIVEELSHAGAMRVIFDLSQLDYIDSAGIGLLALASGKLKESGGSLAIVAPEGRVSKLLRMTQMDSIIAVHATLEDGFSAFGRTLPPASA